MIPVVLKPEPATFDLGVRQLGKAFLQNTPNPSSKEFKPHSYWKNSSKELHAAYSGICAYSCFYLIPPGTTDHFLPKSTHPNEAYEWVNYRLCSHRINLNKGDSPEIVDPFVVQSGWFVLDTPSCLILPAADLADVIKEQIAATIRILKLNDDDYFVQERCDLMMAFAVGNVTLGFLSSRYPFLAAEIQRQNLQETASEIFKTRSILN